MNSRLLRIVSIVLAGFAVLGLVVAVAFLGISLAIVDVAGAAAAAVVIASPGIIGGLAGMAFGLAGATLADIADDVKTMRIVAMQTPR